MKFNVKSKELYSALSAVSKVINSKNTMTILNNFLFDVQNDYLYVTASDLENTLTARVAVSDVEEPGRFCADARRSVELFKELPEMMIEFSVDKRLNIDIDYPGGHFNFVGIDGNEYPSTSEEINDAEAKRFTAPAEQLLDGINNTLFAVGTDELRPQMMGIFLDIKEDGITFVATDTRKLVKYVNKTSAPGVECSCIFPSKPASILRNILGKGETANVVIGPKSAIFSNDDFILNSRLIKGNFPDYNRVIPQANPYVLTVDRQLMLNALKRVAVFVDPGHGLVKIRLTPELIEMKAQDNNFCTSGRESVPCSFTGTNMIIGFSAPYLIDIFDTIDTTDAIVKLADPSRPGLFLPEENEADTELQMLLMPMTVGEF